MGHTLVAVFEEDLTAFVPRDACKIPFGRSCVRADADRILPHHITVIHWGKALDTAVIPRLQSIQFHPCSVTAERIFRIDPAEEGSILLGLSLRADPGFSALLSQAERLTGLRAGRNLHATLSVGKDRALAERHTQLISAAFAFPMKLHIRALELYHIWKPVRHAGVLDASGFHPA